MAKANVPAWTVTILGIVLLIIGGILLAMRSSKSSTDTSKTLPIVLLSVGGLFLIVGIILFFVIKPKKEKKNE